MAPYGTFPTCSGRHEICLAASQKEWSVKERLA